MPLSRSEQLSVLGIAMRLLATERWYAAMLSGTAAILVAVSIAPPLLLGSAARAGQRELLANSGGVSLQRTNLSDATQFDAFQRQARDHADVILAGHLLGPAELASLGPLTAASVNGVPPSAPPARGKLLVGYSSDLGSHVEVVQGRLPEAIPDPSMPAASMAEDRADQMGLHLGDQICFATQTKTGEPGQWCARLVGLWRRVNSKDPYWAAGTPRPDLFANRAGFFSLLSPLGIPGASGQRWYWPDPTILAPADAGSLGDRVRRVRDVAAGSPSLDMRSSLDQQLRRYAAARSVATFSLELVTAALLALTLLLIAVLARLLVKLQARELILLIARGWAPARTERLLTIQLGVVAATGIPGGVVLAWLALVLLAPSHAVWPLTGLDLPDLAGPGVALAASLLGVQLVFVFVASWATRSSGPSHVPPEQQVETIEPPPHNAVTGLLALSAASLLFLPRLAAAQPPSALGKLVGAFGYLICVGALVMLVIAAMHLVSPASAMLARGYRGVEGTVARWQLRAWWRRHSALGFIVVFATATATFAAVNMTHLLFDGGVSPGLLGPGPFRRGVVAALGAGVVAAVIVGLLGFAAELSFACKARLPDFAALMADGLPARSIRRSLALEHNHVLLLGLPMGAVLGLVMVWSVAPVAELDGQLPVPSPALSVVGAALGVLITAAPMLIGGLLAGGLVRSRVRFLPFELQRAPL